MLAKAFNVLLVFLATQAICSAKSEDKDTAIALSDYPISVHDPMTGIEYKAMVASIMEVDSSPVLMYGGLPCYCQDNECWCCSNIQVLNWSRKICLIAMLRLRVPPLTLILTVNDRVVRQVDIGPNTQLCVDLPFFTKICADLKNMHIDRRSVHFCTNVHMSVFALRFSLFYRCLNITSNGVVIENFLLSYNQTTPQIEQPIEPEVYDMVDFEEQEFEIFENNTSLLSADEEAQIGQLKVWRQ